MVVQSQIPGLEIAECFGMAPVAIVIDLAIG
jgi:hypothetical protein